MDDINKKVLIIDRDNDTIDSIDRLLLFLGFETEIARTSNIIRQSLAQPLHAVFINPQIRFIEITDILGLFNKAQKSAPPGQKRPNLFFMIDKNGPELPAVVFKFPNNGIIERPFNIGLLFEAVSSFFPMDVPENFNQIEEDIVGPYKRFLYQTQKWLKNNNLK